MLNWWKEKSQLVGEKTASGSHTEAQQDKLKKNLQDDTLLCLKMWYISLLLWRL